MKHNMEPPIKPDETDCCNSGCNPCIFDVYEQRLEKYKKRQIEATVSIKTRTNCLDQLKYTLFELINMESKTPDTNLYTFRYVTPNLKDDSKEVFYNPGQHFLVKAYSQKLGSFFTRAYTPIPITSLQKHEFAVLIKIYVDGEMSKYFKNMQIGYITKWRGPYGDFKIDFRDKRLLFIAQGSGIAPIYSIIVEILNNERCDTIMKLLFCVRRINDIILRSELYNFLSYWNFNYEVFLSASDNGDAEECKYNEILHKTRLGLEYLSDCLDKFKESRVIICGNDVFNKSMKDLVQQCAINCDNIYVF